MSLKGSLQTVALPEVLGFLSGTGKTGELKVDGTTGAGCLWFNDGVISGIQVERGPNPVEAVFQLLRIEDGEFAFDAGEVPTDEVRRVEAGDGQVTEVLEQAQQRMVEWGDIVAVVPSLEHRVALAADAPEDSILLERSQWSLVVAIGEGRTVGQIIAAGDLGEFDGCRAIKTLVEASLATVEAPAAEEAPVTAPFLGSPIANALSGIQGFGFQPEVATEAPAGEFTLAAGDAAPGAPAPEEPVTGESTFGVPAETVEAEPFAAEGVDTDELTDDPDPTGDPFASLQSLAGEAADAVTEGDFDGAVAPEPVAMPAFGSDVTFEIPAGEVGGYDPTGVPTEGRAALQALLDEVTSSEHDGVYDTAEGDAAVIDEAVDGLADRGPWTHNELASFDGWRDEEAAAQAALQAAGVTSYAPEVSAAPEAAAYGDLAAADGYATGDYAEETVAEVEEEPAPAEEPINRGLLLKFLSSVRN